MGCLEETFFWTLEIIFSSFPVVHNEIDVDFVVYTSFQIQNIDFKNNFSQESIPSEDPVFIYLPRDLKSDREKYYVVLRLKKTPYGQSEVACLWYENPQNDFLDRGFVAIKVDPWLFMSKTVICVVYMNGCLFWEHSKF